MIWRSCGFLQKYDEQEALGTPQRVIDWINGVLAGDVAAAVSVQ
jgi:hypothetical protein